MDKGSKSRLAIFIGAVFFFLSGCGSAYFYKAKFETVIHEDHNELVPSSGVINLEGAHMPAMREAHEIMLNYCKAPYKYELRENEVHFTCLGKRK